MFRSVSTSTHVFTVIYSSCAVHFSYFTYLLTHYCSCTSGLKMALYCIQITMDVAEGTRRERPNFMNFLRFYTVLKLRTTESLYTRRPVYCSIVFAYNFIIIIIPIIRSDMSSNSCRFSFVSLVPMLQL